MNNLNAILIILWPPTVICTCSKNNLLFYGMVPDSIPELPNSLGPRVFLLLLLQKLDLSHIPPKDSLHIDWPTKWVSRKIWSFMWWFSTTLSEIESYNSWHCIDMIRNTAFPIGEIFCCLGARPLQIQPRHHPPNSSEEGECWTSCLFNFLFSVGAFDNWTWDPRL